jgi:hypothetical protein
MPQLETALREERCDITGLRRFECACPRCRGPYVPPPRQPAYSIREVFDDQYGPFLEIWKDGYPIHSSSRAFRFNVAEAKMILASIAEIGRFAETDDDERLQFQPTGTVLHPAKTGHLI